MCGIETRLNLEFDGLQTKWKRYFFYLGVDFDQKKDTWIAHFMQMVTFIEHLLFVCLICFYIIKADGDWTDKGYYISSLNYCIGGLGRMITPTYMKNDLRKCLERLSSLYPSKQCMLQYNLGSFKIQAKRLESLLLWFMHSVLIIFWLMPTLVAAVNYLLGDTEHFQYPLMYDFIYPFMEDQTWLVHFLVYVHQIHMAYTITFLILANDLCLFIMLIQLSLQFDMLAQKLREINPSEEGAERKLRELIVCHCDLINLVADVNRIFAPSLTISLMTSSFIFCFNGFQLLDNLSAQALIRTLFVLCYELKQVIIVCYYGEKLTQNSERIFYELYNQNWMDGTPKYKKLLIITMCRAQRPSALQVAKLSNLNLLILKEVFSYSYQAFNLLRQSRN